MPKRKKKEPLLQETILKRIAVYTFILLALYVFGAFLLFLDIRVFQTEFLFELPDLLWSFIMDIYDPIDWLWS